MLDLSLTWRIFQSCYTINHIQIASLPVSADDVRNETRGDIVLKHVSTILQSGEWPKTIENVYRPYYDRRHELSTEDNIILWGLKVVIPTPLRQNVLKELHNQYLGIIRMKSLCMVPPN